MNQAQIRDRVSRYLARVAPRHTFRGAEDIFALGFVNSLEAVRLVSFLEQEFGIRVPDGDRRLANFRTLDAITAYVDRHLP